MHTFARSDEERCNQERGTKSMHSCIIHEVVLDTLSTTVVVFCVNNYPRK